MRAKELDVYFSARDGLRTERRDQELQKIRKAARELADAIDLAAPDCADKSVAIRKVRESVQAAEDMVLLEGSIAGYQQRPTGPGAGFTTR